MTDRHEADAAGEGGQVPFSAAFPEGDTVLARSFIYEHPFGRTTQILVQIYSDGSIDVAERPDAGATWSAPWSLKEVESW